MVFTATFNNKIFQLYRGSHFYWWRKPRPAASHQQTLSHNVVSSTPRHERDSNSQL
jgi:phage terminase large subunit GpA-like protein